MIPSGLFVRTKYRVCGRRSGCRPKKRLFGIDSDSAQAYRFEQPTPFVTNVDIVIVSETVQSARRSTTVRRPEQPVFHCPNPSGARRRGNADFGHVAMMYTDGVLETCLNEAHDLLPSVQFPAHIVDKI